MDKNVYTIEEVERAESLGRAGRNFRQRCNWTRLSIYPDVKETVHRLIMQAYVCHENPRLQGCLRLLERIKARVEEEKRS